jgi:hypothetical protein
MADIGEHRRGSTRVLIQAGMVTRPSPSTGIVIRGISMSGQHHIACLTISDFIHTVIQIRDVEECNDGAKRERRLGL